MTHGSSSSPRANVLGVILDTNILLDILHFADPLTLPIQSAIEDHTVQLISNPACREEFVRVLGYPRFGITDAAPLVAWFDRYAQLMAADPHSPPIRLAACSDADDQKFLECARDAAHAFPRLFLISKDKAVLKMKSRMKRDVGVQIVSPRDWFLIERAHAPCP